MREESAGLATAHGEGKTAGQEEGGTLLQASLREALVAELPSENS